MRTNAFYLLVVIAAGAVWVVDVGLLFGLLASAIAGCGFILGYMYRKILR